MRLIDNYYNVILWKKDGHIQHHIMTGLSFDFLNENFDYVMFLKFDPVYPSPDPDIIGLIKSLETIFSADQDTFIVLTDRKSPPLYTESADEFIYSFSSNFNYFKQLVYKFNNDEIPASNLLFELLNLIFSSNSAFGKIVIRQIPVQINPSPILTVGNYDVIIPHRGENDFLKNVLFFLSKIDGVHVYAGIDQEISDEIVKLKNEYAKTSFYSFNPNPAGPYVIRNRLIDLSKNDLLFFQDSDDIPCADRFAKIFDYMSKTGCQLCGSHELRIDYLDKTVRAHRFPIDVVAALQRGGPGHPLFHPTSAMTRKDFYLCGKLSEERAFANDTKFLLHSFFVLNTIKNIDEFLYIRRRHANSLTTSAGTMIGSPIRRKLAYYWNSDFTFIKSGELLLKNSRLNYEPSKLRFEVRKL